jgi:hypothetical protein
MNFETKVGHCMAASENLNVKQTSRNTSVRRTCPINFDQVRRFFIPDRSKCPAFIQAACIQNGVAKAAKPGKKRKERAEQQKDEKNRPETKFNEKWKQDHESLVYDREEMKMHCTECAHFYGEKIKKQKVS